MTILAVAVGVLPMVMIADIDSDLEIIKMK
jgi:hypothetical protein